MCPASSSKRVALLRALDMPTDVSLRTYALNVVCGESVRCETSAFDPVRYRMKAALREFW